MKIENKKLVTFSSQATKECDENLHTTDYS